MKKSLKILIFDGTLKTTSFINRLAGGLAMQHEVYILGFNMALNHKISGVNYKPLGGSQDNLSFALYSIKYALSTRSLWKIFSTIKKLFKGQKRQLQEQNLHFVLNEIAPDIIHLQWPSVLPWFEEVLIQQEIPILLSQRGFHNNVRPFVDQENFEYLHKWYPKIAGFHSVSSAIAANGDKIWNGHGKINKVVYTGLPLKEFPFSKKYKETKPLRLLSVGRPHWVKGYDYALECCKILRERDICFHYSIIGGAGKEELLFLISDLGLEECVSLEPRLPYPEVCKRMQEASLLLLPSVEEGLPNVIVEAMALGLPVISTNCGGVPELIDDGVEGWIVPLRDPEAMGNAIVSFSHLSIERINQVRKAARKKVEMQHNVEEMVRGMEELYYEMLSTTKGTEKVGSRGGEGVSRRGEGVSRRGRRV